MKKLLLCLATLMVFQSQLVWAWGQPEPEQEPDTNTSSDFDFFKNSKPAPTMTQRLGGALGGTMLSETGDKVLGVTALGSIALLGKMVINNNNDLSDKYEEELLLNPGQTDNILAELQTMKFAENQNSGPGYLIFAKNIGIGHEFAEKEDQLENTEEYKQNLQILQNLSDQFEKNPDWQEDYSTFRYKKFLEFYNQASKYPAMDEGTKDFIVQLSKLKREDNFLNLDNPYLTTSQKEKMKQIFNCDNKTYRKMIYDSLFTTPSTFENSYAYVLVSNDIWYKSGLKKKEDYVRNIGNNEFDMNSFGRLGYLRLKGGDGMQNDHIPSIGTLKEFMKNNGYIVSDKIIEGTLRENTSAIAVLTKLHMHGRSWGAKNKPIMTTDATDLKLTALKDYNTYVLSLGDTAFNNRYGLNEKILFQKSFLILQERNKLLCLYR